MTQTTAKSARKGVVQALKLVAAYLKRRLAERSTWAAIGTGVTGAGMLMSPWSYVFVVCGIIGALVPTSGEKLGA